MDRKHIFHWFAEKQWHLTHVLVGVMIVSGFFLGQWFLKRSDQALRTDILHQAKRVAESINVEQLRGLSGNAADLETIEYSFVKRALAVVRSINVKYKYLYLLRRQSDGNVVYLLDSEEPASKPFVTPGVVYQNDPGVMRRVFEASTAVVQGQGKDQRLSVLVPVYDLATDLSGLVTKDSAREMVGKAEAYYKEHGREQLLKVLNDPKGEFHSGGLYAFAYDLGMTILAHPIKASLVGQHLLDMADSKGKFFRKEIQNVAMSEGSGWVDYTYENPANKRMEPKTTFVLRVDDLIVCAGAYKGTGEQIAVLGIDIEAHDWWWSLAARASLPIGAIIIFYVGLCAILLAARHTSMSAKPVLQRLMPAFTVLLSLIMTGAGLFFWYQYQQDTRASVESLLLREKYDLKRTLNQISTGLGIAGRVMVADRNIQIDLRAENADKLLADWASVFEILREKDKLTHLYFLNKERVCLLRVHAPQMRGDRINRFTTLEAERTGQEFSGLELGPLGTLTLRVVIPVFEAKDLVGYIELGQEISDILPELSVRSRHELAVLVHKDFLRRDRWEEGMRQFDRAPEWDRLSKHVVVYASQGRLPDIFASLLENKSWDGVSREVVFDGNDWRVMTTALYDASGVPIGDLILMDNIMDEKAEYRRLLVLGGTMGIILLAVLMGTIYVLLRQTDREIQAQQATLRDIVMRYELVVSGSSGVWDWDVSRKNSHFSSTWKAMRGYKDDEIKDNEVEWSAGIHPEDEIRVMRAVQAHFARKTEVFEEQYRIRCKDGSWKWVMNRGKAIFNAAGQVIRMAGSEIDITERMEAEKAVVVSEARLRSIMNNVSAGIFRLTMKPQIKFVQANVAVARILGCSTVESLFQISVEEFFQEAQDLASYIAELQRERVLNNREIRLKRQDGKSIYCSVNSTAQYDDKGNIVWIDGILEDISEIKKKAEAEIERTHQLEVFFKASIRREERIIELKQELTRVQDLLKRNDVDKSS